MAKAKGVQAKRRTRRENTDQELVRRRKMALLESGLTQKDLTERWAKKFGSCTKSLTNAIVLGHGRSHEKEMDFAKLVKKQHSDLFVPVEARNVSPDRRKRVAAKAR